MPALDRAIVLLAAALALAALAGLRRRSRVDACYSFAAYLATVVMSQALVGAWPSRFWTWDFWLATDVLQTGTHIACAAEVTFRTFRPLPAGQARARRLFAVLVTATVAALAFPGPTTTAFDLTLLVSRFTYGVGFLFAAYLGLTAYYHVPVDPVHRDVAQGFVLLTMLVAFTHDLSYLDPIMGWGRDTIVKLTYPLLLLWWAQRAWAQEEATALPRASMEHLQPWRVKRIQWE